MDRFAYSTLWEALSRPATDFSPWGHIFSCMWVQRKPHHPAHLFHLELQVDLKPSPFKTVRCALTAHEADFALSLKRPI